MNKQEGSEYRSGGISFSNLKAFSSFKYPGFCLYFGAWIGDMAALNIQVVARSLLIYRLTGSATLLGITALTGSLPAVFLVLFGGVFADRLPKKHIMLLGRISNVIIYLGVALALTSGYLSAERAGSWWILIVAAALRSIVIGLVSPSRQAMLPELVGTELVMNALSLNNIARNILRLVAPLAAGLLIDAFGFQAIYYTMTGTSVMAVVFTIFLPHTSTLNRSGNSALAELREGLKFVRQNRHILYIVVFAFLSGFLSMAYVHMMPIFADDILKVGATGMGIMVSLSAVGAIIGLVFLASSANQRRGLMMLTSGLVLGLALAGFSASTMWYLSLFLLVFVGLGHAARMTLANTLVQHYSPDYYRGRMVSLHLMAQELTFSGIFFVGLLADSIGVQWSMGGFALLLAFLSALALVLLPRLRKLD